MKHIKTKLRLHSQTIRQLPRLDAVGGKPISDACSNGCSQIGCRAGD